AKLGLIGNPVGATHLHGTVDDPIHRFGHEHFGERRLVLDRLSHVDLRRHMPCHETRRMQIDMAVCNQTLHQLVVCQRSAKRMPYRDVGLGNLHGPARHADITHAVRDAGRLEAHLCVLESTPDLSQHGVILNETVVEAHFAMRGQTGADAWNVAYHLVSWIVGFHDEHRRTGFGTRHHNGEGSANGPTDEPFMSVYDPAIVMTN